MRVFRVQHPSLELGSQGPYIGTDNEPENIRALKDLLSEIHSADSNNHPGWFSERFRDSDGLPLSPAEFSGLVNSSCYLAGFRSLDQLKKWFNEDERALLDEHGFRYYEITVPDQSVFYGEHQVAFRAAHATEQNQVYL